MVNVKIYPLPINKNLQPGSQPFRYPAHNRDYGVEQDFFSYLRRHGEFLADRPDDADWHYLPVYWTRYHLNHDYGKSGISELAEGVKNSIVDDTKTFTVCQYDDGPLADLGKTKLFLSSRKTDVGTDIPLLCDRHRLPLIKPPKKYLASFVGNFHTHAIRERLRDELKDRKDIFIKNGNFGSKFFIRKALESYIGLCPRGYGGSSFRFFESMQLSCVPFLIGDIDTRPFKKHIDWEKISFYSDNAHEVRQIIDAQDRPKLKIMGKNAHSCWKNFLSYGKWCDLLIKELEES